MEKDKYKGIRAVTAARIFALLLILCLVECATEQRINRGSKPSNLIEKINGWRSQRGGSCLSYGHSCWGAHGKRSGKPPAAAPDWYLNRILRRMAASAEMKQAHRASNNDDINAIFREENVDVTSPDKLTVDSAEGPLDLQFRNPVAKPMLDDDMLSKMKLWQLLRDSSDDK